MLGISLYNDIVRREFRSLERISPQTMTLTRKTNSKHVFRYCQDNFMSVR